DVIARLPGAERPDEWIIRGNHHDAWVNGANDPISGLVPLLAEAKAIAELHKSGWTPKRTIVFAAWDGEEPGLLGSTEWAEDDGGSYHSIYDSFAHYTRFGDPTFEYGIALAQTVGRVVLRLADADVLPFEFTAFADTLGRYVTEVGKLADDMRDETEETNRR